MIHKQNDKPQNKDRWYLYKKKFRKGLYNILLYFTIAVIFSGFIFGLNLYRQTLLNFDSKNITELKDYIKVVRKESKETRDNLNLAKKYNNRWNQASSQQKNAEGINSQLLGDVIRKLAKKYDIRKYDFKMSVPRKFGNEASKKKVSSIFISNCQVSFAAPDDVRAIEFLRDLRKSLTGYIVINQLSISKNKTYEFKDLVKISTGQISGILNVKAAFSWHVMKR